MLDHDGRDGITAIGLYSRADFVQDHSQRIDVAALVAGLPLGLLRRNVEWGPQPRAALGTRAGAQKLDDAKIRQDGFATSE